jgi:hypothetical protein
MHSGWQSSDGDLLVARGEGRVCLPTGRNNFTSKDVSYRERWNEKPLHGLPKALYGITSRSLPWMPL